MNNIKFFNEDCFATMNTMVEFDEKVDIIWWEREGSNE